MMLKKVCISTLGSIKFQRKGDIILLKYSLNAFVGLYNLPTKIMSRAL